MKMRVRGNSLRLRLTRTEVAALAADGVVAERTPVAPGRALGYCVRIDRKAEAVSADYLGDSIVVSLPAGIAAAWAESEQVSIEAEQQPAGDEPLRILVEKDFACLAERPGEDDSDAYPHPEAD